MKYATRKKFLHCFRVIGKKTSDQIEENNNAFDCYEIGYFFENQFLK